MIIFISDEAFSNKKYFFIAFVIDLTNILASFCSFVPTKHKRGKYIGLVCDMLGFNSTTLCNKKTKLVECGKMNKIDWANSRISALVVKNYV